MAQDDQICLKELKTLRAQVDWKIRKERHKFFLQLYPLVKDWSGQLPNLKDIFRPKEIDWLLTDSMNRCGKGKGYDREIFIKFVARTGYKDEPKVGEGKKLSLRHTTALHCAARLDPEKFSSESVNELFQIYERFEVNYTDKRGTTHFHAACKYGCHEVVEKFLELGQDPNCRTKKWGDTPLILALTWGHGRVVELLLRNGAHLHVSDGFGHTPLHLICQKKYDFDLVKLFFKIFDEQHQLVEVNARNQCGRTPLHFAARSHFNKVIELLLKRGADINLVDKYGSTPLHMICAGRDVFDDTADIDGGLVELFFKINDEKHQPVEVNARDCQGRTPLHYAVRRGCRFKRTTELLLRRGANPIVADKDGSTPLHFISNLRCKCNEENYNDCLLELFFKICDEQHQLVEINARDKFGAIPLHYAVDHLLKKTTELLLRRGANPNLAIQSTQSTVYWIGLTPLHMICERDSSAIFLKFFFDVNNEIHQSVEVDAVDKYGNAPLHSSLESRHFRVAEVLLKGGANPNLVNENGSLPLHLICGIRYNDDEVDAFLKVFFEICAEKNQKVQVDARDKRGRTPLQLALDHGNKKAAEVLLKNGSDPNLANEEGSTLLHYIFKNRHEDSVVKFLKIFFEINDNQNRQVLIDARDKSGKTPLQLAVMSFLPNAIDILLDHGADLSKFVFPSQTDFDQSFQNRSVCPVNLKALCNAMVVVERLQKRGYKLNRQDALIIMNLFAKYGFFDRSESLEFWLNDEEFVEDAKKKILRNKNDYKKDKEVTSKAEDSLRHSSLSLYDLILVPLEKGKKLFTYEDYSDFAGNNCCWFYIDEKQCQACLVHLSDIMSKGFFRSWALESLLDLTHNRLPIICCELIIKNLMNEDLFNICLAAEIAVKEESQST